MKEIFQNKKYLPSYFMERMLLPRVVKHDIYKDKIAHNVERQDKDNDAVVYFIKEHAHLNVRINLEDQTNITIVEYLNNQLWIEKQGEMIYKIYR